MKQPLIIGALVLVLLSIAVGAYVFIGRSTPAPDLTGEGSEEPLFPSSSGSMLGQGDTLAVAGSDGSMLTVRDFIDGTRTEEDPANPGTYYLAGASGYCDESGSCLTGAPAEGYTIVYLKEDDSFMIALTKEPLGESRRNAEQFLLSALGVTPETLCALNYYLSTDGYTSTQYAGTNLGFSFCPGATVLP